MMMQPKKIAMLIVKGLADSGMDMSEHKSEMSKDEDDKPSSSMGVEAAMEKFINAVHSKDTQKAIEAMCEFNDMQQGAEYFNKSEDNGEY